MMSLLGVLVFSILGTGVGVFALGLYFWIFGAGLPYQDPTTELQIQWMANNMAGELCMKAGGVFITLGIISVVIWVIFKQQKNHK